MSQSPRRVSTTVVGGLVGLLRITCPVVQWLISLTLHVTYSSLGFDCMNIELSTMMLFYSWNASTHKHQVIIFVAKTCASTRCVLRYQLPISETVEIKRSFRRVAHKCSPYQQTIGVMQLYTENSMSEDVEKVCVVITSLASYPLSIQRGRASTAYSVLRMFTM